MFSSIDYVLLMSSLSYIYSRQERDERMLGGLRCYVILHDKVGFNIIVCSCIRSIVFFLQYQDYADILHLSENLNFIIVKWWASQVQNLSFIFRSGQMRLAGWAWTNRKTIWVFLR